MEGRESALRTVGCTQGKGRVNEEGLRGDSLPCCSEGTRWAGSVTGMEGEDGGAVGGGCGCGLQVPGAGQPAVKTLASTQGEEGPDWKF